MPTVFISYRRFDSQDVAGRIYDRLVEKYSFRHVFKDVDSIPLGVSFPLHLRNQMQKAEVVLVIIGRSWLHCIDECGRRRLDDPNDFVRLEVEQALRNKVPVIPVLVSSARMPLPAELPASMQALVSRNGIHVRPDPDFNNDMARLIGGLDRLEKKGRPGSNSQLRNLQLPTKRRASLLRIASALLGIFLLAAIAAVPCWYYLKTVAARPQNDGRFIEFRRYTVAREDLQYLKERWRNLVKAKLLEKHGMSVVGLWLATKKPADEKEKSDNRQQVVLILAHSSALAAKASWDSLRKDPDWIAIKKAAEPSGRKLDVEIDSQYFSAATFFSPRETIRNSIGTNLDLEKKDERVFEFRLDRVVSERSTSLPDHYRNRVKVYEKHGIDVLGFWSSLSPENPQDCSLFYILAYPDATALKEKPDRVINDPEYVSTEDARRRFGLFVAKNDKETFLAMDWSLSSPPVLDKKADLEKKADPE